MNTNGNFGLDDQSNMELEDCDDCDGCLECAICKTPIMVPSNGIHTEYDGYVDTFDFCKWLEETILGSDGICRSCVKTIDKLVEHTDWPKIEYPSLLTKVRDHRRLEIEYSMYM